MHSTAGRRTPLVLALIGLGLVIVAVGGGLALFSSQLDGEVQAVQHLRLAGLVVAIGGLGVAVAGLTVEVFGPLRSGRAAAAAGFGSHRVLLSATALAIVLALLLGNLVPLLLFVGQGQREMHNLPGMLAGLLSPSLSLLGVAYVRFFRPGVVRAADLGFDEAHGQLGRLLLDLLVGLAGGFGILVLNALTGLLLREAGVEQTQLRDLAWVRNLPPEQFLVIFLVGAVLAPIAEELFFRGVVFLGYLRAHGPVVAYVMSAVVFACLHVNLPALLPILVLALALSWLFRATGSIVPAIVAHGVNNGVGFLALYLGAAGGPPGGG